MKFKGLFYNESFNIVLDDINPKLSALLLVIAYCGMLLTLIAILAIIAHKEFNTNINNENAAYLLIFGFGLIGIWTTNISSILLLKNKHNKARKIENYFYLHRGIKKSENYLYSQLWTGITFFIGLAVSLLIPFSILSYILSPALT